MKSLVRIWIIAAGLASLAALPACFPVATGAVAGAGAYAYSRGGLGVMLPKSVDAVWGASRGAVSSLGLVVKEQRKDDLGGKLVASQAKGADVTITVERRGDDATRLDIRVGLFGDEEKSRAILRAIEARL
jgi:hypothetical protein